MENQDRWQEEMGYWVHMSDVVDRELEQLLREFPHPGHHELFGEIRYWMKDYVEMIVLKHVLSELMEQPHNDLADIDDSGTK